MIKIGVVGYGYWGPNIVRNFQGIEHGSVRAVCDINPKNLARVQKSYPTIETTANYRDLCASSELDAIAVVTPVASHYPMVKTALEHGKHVFVEKPFTASVGAGRGADRARRKEESEDHGGPHVPVHRRGEKDQGAGGRRRPRDPLLLRFDPRKPRPVPDRRECDLGPGAARLLDHALPDSEPKPEAVVATGRKHVNGIEDVAYITVYFTDNVIAHFNVNWLSPVKVRTHADRRGEEDAGVERP